MEVIRTKAVDRNTPVTNVFVDAENQKWVGNSNGLYKVFSPEQGSSINLEAAEWSLMQTHDGNADLRFPMNTLVALMGDHGQKLQSNSDRITAATYNEKRDQLWIGTRKSGLFQFKTKPSLQLVKRHHSGNSKMPSNQINTLLLDSRGILWVGTYGGAFLEKGGKWELKEKGFSFSAFAQNDTDVWAMGDNLLWKINVRGKWDPIDIDAELMENDVADIAFDQDGLLWVVSDIVSRYDPATEEATVFGPAIGFTSQDVYCVAVDNNNGVWIGTNDKGLYLIQKAASLYVACDIVKPISCKTGAKDGALKVNVSGGEGPYTYKWNTALTGAAPDQLGPGEYAVTVVDARGKSNSASVVLNDPTMKLEVKQGKQSGADGAANGSATVNVKGGQPAYTYLWDSGETTATAFQLNEGKHAVTVTDKNGCTASNSIEIGKEIAGLDVAIAASKEIACAGDETAAIDLEVKGGKAPFSYKWNVPRFSGKQIENVPPGAYTVTVSDASGQTATTSLTIESPAPLAANISVNAPASTGNEDGDATVSVSGGTGKYQFKWSNGETTAQAVKLGPTDHSVTVTDEAGCEAVALVKITEDILPLSVAINQSATISCFGAAEGALDTKVKGGKGPFKFNWSGGGASAALKAVKAGDYSVTVTDVTGATASNDFSIKEPKKLELSAVVKSPASTGNADGKATAKASGGTGDLVYKWSNGETAREAAKLGPGEHQVTVTDEKGCQAQASVLVQENILELNAAISQTTGINCAGASTGGLSVEVTGGKAPFSYKWNESTLSGKELKNIMANTYALTITDAVGTTATAQFKLPEPQAISVAAKVDSPASTGKEDGQATITASGGTGKLSYRWDNGETTPTAKSLAPGEHNVTVTDASACTGVAVVTIRENILALNADIIVAQEISCTNAQDGALEVNISGGKGPYQYDWNQTTAQGEKPSNLAAGRYVVTIADATGKTMSAGVELVSPPVLEAVLLKSRPTTTAETTNGRATLKVSGGTTLSSGNSKYLYKWDNGETGAIAESLGGGNHSVTIADANGCETTVAFETKIRIIPELSSNNLRTGETIKLNNIYFQTDSTQMDPSSIPTVDELFDFLVENDNIVIEVGGHTNGIPSHAYCDQLSTERSKSVAQYLVDKGIPASQLRYKGYGKRDPVATNATPEGRAKNQRVEIKVLEIK